MNHQRQPPGSAQCGQTCVAMLADVPRELVVAEVGDQATTGLTLRHAMQRFGLKGLPFVRSCVPQGPCIAMIEDRTSWRGHWVAVDGLWVFDPEREPESIFAYAAWMGRKRGRDRQRFSGFIPVVR